MKRRPPQLNEAKLTAEQQVVYDRIMSGPRGVVEGPLRVWLQRPALADAAQNLGAYCRYGSSLSPRLSELAIIVVGAHWRAGFEWFIHAPIAEEAGVPADAIKAIRSGSEPAFRDAELSAVYRFTRELLIRRGISSHTYSYCKDILGEAALVDLVGVIGYYGLISMTIKAFDVPVPEGETEPFGREDAEFT